MPKPGANLPKQAPLQHLRPGEPFQLPPWPDWIKADRKPAQGRKVDDVGPDVRVVLADGTRITWAGTTMVLRSHDAPPLPEPPKQRYPASLRLSTEAKALATKVAARSAAAPPAKPKTASMFDAADEL